MRDGVLAGALHMLVRGDQKAHRRAQRLELLDDHGGTTILDGLSKAGNGWVEQSGKRLCASLHRHARRHARNALDDADPRLGWEARGPARSRAGLVFSLRKPFNGALGELDEALHSIRMHAELKTASGADFEESFCGGGADRRRVGHGWNGESQRSLDQRQLHFRQELAKVADQPGASEQRGPVCPDHWAVHQLRDDALAELEHCGSAGPCGRTGGVLGDLLRGCRKREQSRLECLPVGRSLEYRMERLQELRSKHQEDVGKRIFHAVARVSKVLELKLHIVGPRSGIGR
mmetsp:Transcript_16869/g.48170  ORF Transcript_16869/g.48170 Transcript_16869/m.48170 type:complete len:290 (-) Transcript_16869:260-1129(-)